MTPVENHLFSFEQEADSTASFFPISVHLHRMGHWYRLCQATRNPPQIYLQILLSQIARVVTRTGYFPYLEANRGNDCIASSLHIHVFLIPFRSAILFCEVLWFQLVEFLPFICSRTWIDFDAYRCPCHLRGHLRRRRMQSSMLVVLNRNRLASS